MIKTRTYPIVALLFMLSASLLTAAKTQAERYNVLFIVVDDLNNQLGVYGNDFVQTTSLDQLARESLTMDAAYCQYPVCGPSRASFQTGFYPETTTILLNEKRTLQQALPGVKTLPEIFRENGYWTASTGKMFNKAQDPGARAWDERIEIQQAVGAFKEAFRLRWESVHGPAKTEDQKAALARAWQQTPKNTQTPPAMGPYPFTDEETQDGRHVLQTIAWMEERVSEGGAFFIGLGIMKPHVPFWAPKKYFDLYPKEQLPLPIVRGNAWRPKPSEAATTRYRDFGFHLINPQSPERIRETLQAYYACVSFIDTQLGKLFSAMQDMGLWENTIIVMTSDNGYHLGENLMWGKYTLYKPSARVPLLIRVPGLTEPGSRTSQLVELVDLLPTLTAICGIELEQDVQGDNLLGLLSNPSEIDPAATAYTILLRPSGIGRALRTDEWTYMSWANGDEELYDAKLDPNEWNNLAGLPSHKSNLQRMRKLLSDKLSSL